MTTPHTPPEDAFDQWLDALVDEEDRPLDDDRAEVAAFLQHHFALPPADAPVSEPGEHAASPSHVGKRPTPITGSPKRAGIVPMGGAGAGWHVASLLSAAVLVLVAIGMIGALLRMGDDDQTGGVSATASMLPFAPSPALASPTPAATCATDDTLLLTPTEPVGAGAFADLPFPVAWLADGTLTVARAGEVLRELDTGDAVILHATPVIDVVLVAEQSLNFEGQGATFVNIATGDRFEIERYHRLVPTPGPFVFWASDRSYARWHVVDLRTFETVDLAEHFNAEPATSWTPYAGPMISSVDGTVMMVGTARYDPINHDASPATPASTNGQQLRIGQDVLLISGSLEDISVIGPIATVSGAVTLSSDGETMAWLARSDQGGERILIIAETDTGRVVGEHPVEATYSNSLLFSADGSALYSTSGTSLEIIPVAPDAATPAASTETITLPDTGYRIFAASPDHTKLLLTRNEHAAGEDAIWLNLETGEIREMGGQPARMWESAFPTMVAPPIGPYMLIDDYVDEVEVIDMATGDSVLTVDRDDGGASIVISSDASSIIAPHHDAIDWLDLDTGTTTTIAAPDTASESPYPIALAPGGDCAVVSWHLDDGRAETSLLTTGNTEHLPLPPSFSGGWVPGDAQNP